MTREVIPTLWAQFHEIHKSFAERLLKIATPGWHVTPKYRSSSFSEMRRSPALFLWGREGIEIEEE